MSDASSHTESEGGDITIQQPSVMISDGDTTARIFQGSTSAPPAVIDQPDARNALAETKPRRLLVLTGVVGSGKSTFATALCKQFPDGYKRACQDVLGSRQAVESYALRQLKDGFDVCIDRTNVDATQRAHWLNLAKECQSSSANSVEVYAIYFDTPFQTCKQRLLARTSHETLHSPDQAVKVLYSFAKQLSPPRAQEGFHKVITIGSEWNEATSSDGVSVQNLEKVLARIEAAPYVPGISAGQPCPGALRLPSSSSRGRQPNRPPPRTGRGFVDAPRGSYRPQRPHQTLHHAWARPPPPAFAPQPDQHWRSNPTVRPYYTQPGRYMDRPPPRPHPYHRLGGQAAQMLGRPPNAEWNHHATSGQEYYDGGRPPA